MWPNQQALESSEQTAKILAVIFAFCAANLFVSLILTITTSPGLIPEEREWDMPDPSQEDPRLGQDAESREQQSPVSRQGEAVGPDFQAAGPPGDAPRGTAQSNVSELLRAHNTQADARRSAEDSG